MKTVPRLLPQDTIDMAYPLHLSKYMPTITDEAIKIIPPPVPENDNFAKITQQFQPRQSLRNFIKKKSE